MVGFPHRALLPVSAAFSGQRSASASPGFVSSYASLGLTDGSQVDKRDLRHRNMNLPAKHSPATPNWQSTADFEEGERERVRVDVRALSGSVCHIRSSAGGRGGALLESSISLEERMYCFSPWMRVRV